ncbi:MAG: M14 metallopeptidase family protein, partial [Flavisolibacter sp.]
MQKRLIVFFIAIVSSFYGFSQLRSPEDFLGYPLGSRYTPHWRIIEYYRHVAAAVPSMVKLEEYGKTNEGRVLMVAYISAASHISNLENIRNNNLGLAGMQQNGNTANAPAIIWLSYNVHGNETSSSEAGMATLYSLVDPSNTQTKQWLQNSFVIIDPCLNPDGRDRYVNWFNSITGTNYNPSLDAREHSEPWPGGRTNHYNHDLNRDWAWQTQLESQQRMKLYHKWMPQIHVDFHEQGINNPYYFAPAAQPYHEVITSWQRDFQFDIGRNHARYFDRQGWLYFTREVFDLLYPSYGDTYPIFNGAIGMTYEQGGGPRGGAAVLTEMGDTLTLLDRIQHHHTTSLSTIEISSLNAGKLVTAFQKYFSDAVNGRVDAVKSYVIKYADQDRQRFESLITLLEKNKIEYGSGREGNYRGTNYHTGKDENFSLAKNDLVVSTSQPKAALVKVLFEPSTTVVDSNTYDITAWALPYVYGLKAFASKEKINVTTANLVKKVDNSSLPTSPDLAYGYIIPWSGTGSVKLVSQLLQKGIRLRMSDEPFVSAGKSFERGAVIVLRTSNQQHTDLFADVKRVATDLNVELTTVASGFVDKGYDFGSSKIRALMPRRVAVITGEGVNSNAAGEVWHFF